ncbi:MAG TPA: hypothetical protein VMD28_01960 [Acidimicrobiales bacterium]|nr:hypothetical protein [Acidimicrobiales bacterium]
MSLGDGMPTLPPRGAQTLRIVPDAKCPLIVAECRRVPEAVPANPVGLARRPGCVELFSHSEH